MLVKLGRYPNATHGRNLSFIQLVEMAPMRALTLWHEEQCGNTGSMQTMECRANPTRRLICRGHNKCCDFPSGFLALKAPRSRTAETMLRAASFPASSASLSRPVTQNLNMAKNSSKYCPPMMAQFLVLGIRNISHSTFQPQALDRYASQTRYFAYELVP